MLQTVTISSEDILQQVKLSSQIPDLIKKIVTCKLIDEVAAKEGITVKTEEIQEAANQMRLINNLHTADDTWAWMQKYSLSLDDFEEMICTNILSWKLATHLFADKIEPYFFENQLEYAGAIIYEVVLDDEDLAIELFYSLQEGEISFTEVALQYIQNKELRRCGGYCGILRRADLRPEISANVFAAKPPQILKPILTAKGYHLILVTEIIQPKLDDQLRLQIASNLFNAWIEKQIEAIEVVTKLN
ncbi:MULTISPECIES: peptidylprolyl isomerase [unclassified Nodularia (in: cyanobacteria)]|uniref:peptidylprolyl isomerase n=1 Tax=unclassified Nodularia (in: cyanobacteria) TaxID=2656917 RepID=UPI001880C9E2|nr:MULTISPECIES: peptidylprolyl isomerase [unclassified Nodularia (in: cyanobacteria)]MBE9197501.1 peptidylprolyl isomerase [Nodularia sp. LEGE 06071]MCC2694386.1 peptidylprolyl isomerase [Nodularia sp. LEGE 04288]